MSSQRSAGLASYVILDSRRRRSALVAGPQGVLQDRNMSRVDLPDVRSLERDAITGEPAPALIQRP